MSKTNFIKKPNIVSDADFHEYLQYLSTIAAEVDKWPDSEKSPGSTHFSEELLKKKKINHRRK